jgi:hypothetical protein
MPGGEAAVRARIAACTGLTLPEAHALVGLLEADGHFAIEPNNAGATHRCYLSLGLRDDDADLLAGLREKTGLGHLTAKPSRRGSKPQVIWSISTRLECGVAASLLADHPMHGRKRHEASVWTDAVLRWSASRYSRDSVIHAELRQLRSILRNLRRYQPDVDLDPALVQEDGFVAYFGGFFTGEGCFTHSCGRPRLTMRLRRDDKPLLDLFAQSFGIGSVTKCAATPPGNPTAVWTVASAEELAIAVELLDSAHLMGRKLRQYRAWRRGAVEVADAARGGRPVNLTVVASARNALAHASAYVPPASTIPSEDAELVARNAYADVLREWASQTRGKLRCSDYELYRRGKTGLPSRNTLSLTFGSWSAALQTAGLAPSPPAAN